MTQPHERHPVGHSQVSGVQQDPEVRILACQPHEVGIHGHDLVRPAVGAESLEGRGRPARVETVDKHARKRDTTARSRKIAR